MNYCLQCAAEHNAKYKFCPDCGIPLTLGKDLPEDPNLSLNKKNESEDITNVDIACTRPTLNELTKILNETHESFDWSDYIECSDGVMYKGEIVDGLRHGQGQSFFAYFPGQVASDGTWYRGNLHGFVRNFNFNGELEFEGAYANGKKNGLGTIYRNTGVKFYEGEFQDDKLTGFGKLYYEDGTLCYQGELLDGNPNGRGTYYHFEKEGGLVLWDDFFMEGETYSGTWEDGSFLRDGTGLR